jgi:hypothetical protein
MSCSCNSSNQAEFPSEILIHFAGFKNVSRQGVWVFPTLLVCMDCGLFQSTVPLSELAQLAGAPNDSSEGREPDNPPGPDRILD